MSQETGFRIEVYAESDVGKVRQRNEDNFLVLNLSTADAWTPETAGGNPPTSLISFAQGHLGTVLAVSDGMGGALAGEVASRMAVENVRDHLLELQKNQELSRFPFHERLRLAIEMANLHIYYEGLSKQEYAGMGATFTAAGLYGKAVYFAQVGDSRAYVIRNGKVRQITRDQSLVGQLVDAGHITEEEAEHHTYKNVILQALGAAPYINVVVNCLALCDGDIIVLCSDGLSNKVRGEEMVQVIERASSLKQSCELLIEMANERGGEDNITVLIAKLSNGQLQPAQAMDEQELWDIEVIARDPELPQDIDSLLEETVPTGELKDVES
jgi:serine/threonine protein phosphatase PrpC